MTNSNPQQKEGVQTRYIGGETLLIYGKKSYAINPPAAFVWKLCDGAHTIEAIVRAVHQEYKLPNGTEVHRQINKILLDFHQKGLLEASE